jgi:hypothetical protein
MTRKIDMPLLQRSFYVLLLLLIPTILFCQKRIITHTPQAELKLPGLLRPFTPELPNYVLEVHPGWLIREILDSTTLLTILNCFDPHDTDRLYMSIISYPYSGLDSARWASTKEYFKTKYGDHGIGLMTLSDQDTITTNPPNGILAIYEVLAKFPDRMEYLASVVTTKEILLLRAPIPQEEYNERIAYFRKIVADLKIKK